MLQKGIQLLNFSQNKKQSTYDTITNYDNFKIITCANTDGIINGFVTLFAFVPAPKTDSYRFLHPDIPTLPPVGQGQRRDNFSAKVSSRPEHSGSGYPVLAS
jgi:hypothetical protein